MTRQWWFPVSLATRASIRYWSTWSLSFQQPASEISDVSTSIQAVRSSTLTQQGLDPAVNATHGRNNSVLTKPQGAGGGGGGGGEGGGGGGGGRVTSAVWRRRCSWGQNLSYTYINGCEASVTATAWAQNSSGCNLRNQSRFLCRRCQNLVVTSNSSFFRRISASLRHKSN